MPHLARSAMLTSAVLAACDAFITTRPGWVPSLAASKYGRRCSSCYATPARIRFLTSRASSSGDGERDVDQPSPPGEVPKEGDESPINAGSVAPSVSSRVLDPGFPNSLSDAADSKDEFAVTLDYPINLPSYLLLDLSSVACIAFIGSIFEVIGPNPQLGYTNTYIIGMFALPTFVFLFYAAIKKGQAEVDEDDARFRSGF